MKRVSKPKQSKIFPGTCGNLTKSAYELKRFKNVSWMWSERDQKVAKQREGCTLHSDMWKYTLLLRQSLITLWLLDYIQNLAFFGNGVPGNDTVILKLTAFADKFLQKKWRGRKQRKRQSLFHTSSFLRCAAKHQQHFYSADAFGWPWHLNPPPDRRACEARDASCVSQADLFLVLVEKTWHLLGTLGTEAFERPFVKSLQRWRAAGCYFLVVTWTAGKQLHSVITLV